MCENLMNLIRNKMLNRIVFCGKSAITISEGTFTFDERDPAPSDQFTVFGERGKEYVLA
jgi:hypothetical protein